MFYYDILNSFINWKNTKLCSLTLEYQVYESPEVLTDGRFKLCSGTLCELIIFWYLMSLQIPSTKLQNVMQCYTRNLMTAVMTTIKSDLEIKQHCCFNCFALNEISLKIQV